MDTKALVVGQEVYLISWISVHKARVVKIAPSGVVDVVVIFPPTNETLRLDKDGCDGPWHLDDMPFAERTAWLEHERKKALNELYLKSKVKTPDVTFNQLPEEIKKHYTDQKFIFGRIVLADTYARLEFWPEDKSVFRIDVWEKKDGDWVVVSSGADRPDMIPDDVPAQRVIDYLRATGTDVSMRVSFLQRAINYLRAKSK